MKNRVIPIFYACDDLFVKYTIVSMKSIMENASKRYNYKFYVLSTTVKQNMINKTIETVKDYENFEVEFVDVSSYLKSIESKLPIRDYYTKTTYYRLFIADMYKDLDKAIYIDSDTVVLGDISKLYNHDLKTNLVGACNEQVMVQHPTYGKYVEEVVGINRNEFFNAGLLLINLKEFRNYLVLDRFLDLLQYYQFVVTQDEDYLNVICKGRVLWLDQSWNVEVFGNIVVKEEDINIIHYIMVSKPWHYKNVKLEEYFLKYASMTNVYDMIIEERDNYPDERKQLDLESVDRLEQTAKCEIERSDSFIKLLNSTNKDHSRVLLEAKMKRYELEGRFSEDLEYDTPGRSLKKGEVDYLKKKVSSKLKRKIAYYYARKYLNKLESSNDFIIKEIKGIENFKNLKKGAIITCNHFNALDSFAIEMAYEASGNTDRLFYRIIREGNYTAFPGFFGFLMRNCNTLPLSDNIDVMKECLNAISKLLSDGHYVLVYPEQGMWWNYEKPRPLKNGAYKIAAKNKVSVLPCFITMENSNKKSSDGYYVKEYTIHIGEEIKYNSNLSEKENVIRMMKENEKMWNETYNSFYKKTKIDA